MASTFNGWGSSWGESWGATTGSGFIRGGATITLRATGSVVGVVVGTATPEEQSKYYAGPSEREKALLRQIREEDEVFLAVIQMFVMEEA